MIYIHIYISNDTTHIYYIVWCTGVAMRFYQIINETRACLGQDEEHFIIFNSSIQPLKYIRTSLLGKSKPRVLRIRLRIDKRIGTKSCYETP
jgi:hypothetical protein